MDGLEKRDVEMHAAQGEAGQLSEAVRLAMHWALYAAAVGNMGTLLLSVWLSGLLTATILLFVLMGVPAGYFSAHTYKSVKGTEWKKNILLTSCFFVGVIFTIFFVLNFFVWGEKSSGAVPFGTLFALLVLYVLLFILRLLVAQSGKGGRAVTTFRSSSQVPRLDNAPQNMLHVLHAHLR